MSARPCDICGKPSTRSLVYPTDPTQERFFYCEGCYIDPDDKSPEATAKLHAQWEDFVRHFSRGR